MVLYNESKKVYFMRSFLNCLTANPDKVAFGFCGGLAGFIAPLPLLVFWMFMFVIIDMFTGMLAARRRGETLSSKKMKRTISKLICYMTVVLLARGINVHVLPFIELKACYIVTGIICFVEMFSVLENMYNITENQVFRLLTQWSKNKMKETTGICPDEKTK